MRTSVKPFISNDPAATSGTSAGVVVRYSRVKVTFKAALTVANVRDSEGKVVDYAYAYIT